MEVDAIVHHLMPLQLAAGGSNVQKRAMAVGPVVVILIVTYYRLCVCVYTEAFLMVMLGYATMDAVGTMVLVAYAL